MKDQEANQGGNVRKQGRGAGRRPLPHGWSLDRQDRQGRGGPGPRRGDVEGLRGSGGVPEMRGTVGNGDIRGSGSPCSAGARAPSPQRVRMHTARSPGGQGPPGGGWGGAVTALLTPGGPHSPGPRSISEDQQGMDRQQSRAVTSWGRLRLALQTAQPSLLSGPGPAPPSWSPLGPHSSSFLV